jgi:hypothetical protein
LIPSRYCVASSSAKKYLSYSGRKITANLGNVTVRGEKMERARGKHDGEESV